MIAVSTYGREEVCPKAKSARIYRSWEGTFVISQDISLGFVCCFSIWFYFLLFFLYLFVLFVFSFMLFQDKWAILINCQCRSYRLTSPHLSHFPTLSLSLPLTLSPTQQAPLFSFLSSAPPRHSVLSLAPTIFSLFVAQSEIKTKDAQSKMLFCVPKIWYTIGFICWKIKI